MSAPLANLVVGFIACGQHAYDTGFNLVEVQSAYALAKQDSKLPFLLSDRGVPASPDYD